jgi:peptidoglycan/xylan/chitin deacetylase (PgdA/CDA1 family)
VISWAARVCRSSLRSATVNGAVRALARLRGNDLVLVYHRVGPFAPHGCEVVPAVPPNVFRSQLQALGETVELVTLDTLLAQNGDRRGARAEVRRPRVAVTFDDDLPSHAEETLPILRELRVPATFFLSGRALHGRGAYWFQHLEALLVAHGELRAAAMLGLPDARRSELVLACEANADVRRRATEAAADLPPPGVLDRESIGALGAAGMTIGFHTVQHDRLPALNDADLSDAVSYGCDVLAEAAGTTVRYFAYPHGKADPRSADAVRRAGFEAAFTGRAQPLRRNDDRYQVGRWEPGAVGIDDLLVNLAVRLHRVAPGSREAAL